MRNPSYVGVSPQFKICVVLTYAPKLHYSSSTKLLGCCKHNTLEAVKCSHLLYPSPFLLSSPSKKTLSHPPAPYERKYIPMRYIVL